MKLLLDYFPIIIFVGIYFWSGAEQPMYPAVQGLIVASFIQTIGVRILTGKFEKLHLWILGLTVVLGGMTLVFRDPLFVQWKASAVLWLTAVVLLYSQLVMKKPLIQQLFTSALEDEEIDVPDKVWAQVNYAWPLVNFIFGFINLYVAFNFSEAFWVKFKLFGIFGMTFVLIGFTIYKLFPFILEAEKQKEIEESANEESPSAESVTQQSREN
ncbi:septation protein IspZ [Aliikangiella marina]|uniref:Inner membrane-spanning protein YciB n=1 Tax=Aliikangiella marina TaxID=1712262 RepID=A0A545T322_9GAMM|nr:inner membrane-spanning protein YciB [Aliikangiella marina]TQV71598.1 septation protein IspZ [Aliikangiella marina]